VQLLFLGVIGEYIIAIFNQVRRRPIVFERERINFEAVEDQDELHSGRSANLPNK
jgi:hypothetical protein